MTLGIFIVRRSGLMPASVAIQGSAQTSECWRCQCTTGGVLRLFCLVCRYRTSVWAGAMVGFQKHGPAFRSVCIRADLRTLVTLFMIKPQLACWQADSHPKAWIFTDQIQDHVESPWFLACFEDSRGKEKQLPGLGISNDPHVCAGIRKT